MKTTVSVAVAAAAMLAGVSLASAATSRMSNRAAASDALTLSATQQKAVWKDISHHASNQTAPSEFNAAVGTALPASVDTYPLPRRAARDVPAVKPYRYAMLQDKVLIVNPSDNKIADVVAK